jgi:hypothetical protein
MSTRSRIPDAVHGLRRQSAGSAPPCPAHTGFPYDAADFASCCGPASCHPHRQGVVAPLRRRALTRRREPRYQGPWRLPGPDFHRLAAPNLSPGYVMTTSQRCSWRPSCWTHTCPGRSRAGGGVCRRGRWWSHSSRGVAVVGSVAVGGGTRCIDGCRRVTRCAWMGAFIASVG